MMRTTTLTAKTLLLSSILLASSLGLATSTYQGPRNIPQVSSEANFVPKSIEELHSVMVRLTVNGGQPLCTATYISPSLLLSAAHCIQNPYTQKRNDAYLNGEKLEVVTFDVDRDVSILRTKTQKSGKFLALEARDAHILFKPTFVACGYGHGVMMCSNPGMFFPENIVDLSIYNVTSNIGPTVGGMSGGPVMDLESGKIVGIVQGGFTPGSGILEGKGIFIPVPVVLDVLEKADVSLKK